MKAGVLEGVNGGPEILEGFAAVNELIDRDAEPAIGIYDLGEHPVNPLRQIKREIWDHEIKFVTYQEHVVVAFPPSDMRRFNVTETQEGTMVLPSEKQRSAMTGMWNGYDIDDRGGAKQGLHHYDTLDPDRLCVPAAGCQLISEGFDLAGEALVDVLAREEKSQPTFLLGHEAITGFIRGFMTGTEATADKRMIWDDGKAFLPKVEQDLRDIMVMAHLAGIPSRDLGIPEEHRYRTMIELADYFAWFVVEFQSSLDLLRKPKSEFRDETQYRAIKDLGHPLHNLMVMEEPQTLKAVTEAYQITVEEFLEAVRKSWYRQSYHFNHVYDPGVEDAQAYFQEPPDPAHAQLFTIETPPDKLDYYDYTIELTVRAALDPDYFRGDVRRIWR